MTNTAILANGCFWCTEAIFDSLQGVAMVEPGYIGGHKSDPSYKEVCNGDTGHAEAIRITYDPAVISYNDLLDIFFETHDPTQLNRQGNDVGTQYRSTIFYANGEEKAAAESAIVRAQPAWTQRIVTTLEPASHFYVAESYHHDYFARVGDSNPYCAYVISPKVKKFRKTHADKLRV